MVAVSRDQDTAALVNALEEAGIIPPLTRDITIGMAMDDVVVITASFLVDSEKWAVFTAAFKQPDKDGVVEVEPRNGWRHYEKAD